jgi:hypothetical protein
MVGRHDVAFGHIREHACRRAGRRHAEEARPVSQAAAVGVPRRVERYTEYPPGESGDDPGWVRAAPAVDLAFPAAAPDGAVVCDGHALGLVEPVEEARESLESDQRPHGRAALTGCR